MKTVILKFIYCYIPFYALYSLSTRFMPTAVLCEGPLADILYKSITLIGGILSLFCLHSLAKRKKADAQTVLLGCFVLLLCLSTILNYPYEFIGNVTGTATFVSQLILFYYLPKLMPETMLLRSLRITAILAAFLWDIGCIASLFQYIRNIHYTVPNPAGNRIRQGIVDGRLFGLFTDPNFAAFTSFILILLLTLMIRHTTRILLKLYGWISIVLNISYIVMSNSRTIYITAISTVLAAVFLATYTQHRQNENSNIRHFLLTTARRGVAALVAMIAIYSLIFFPMRQVGQIFAPERAVNDLVREDVNADNITNNRSTIWKNYLSLAKDKPVFGFSLHSALPYATEHYPESYLAKTQYVTHNGYLSLLIETGIAGFGIMTAFFILIIIQSTRSLTQRKNIGEEYLFFVTLIVSVLIFLLCFHDVFFTVNIETMLLFLSMGYVHCSNKNTLMFKSSLQSATSTD